MPGVRFGHHSTLQDLIQKAKKSSHRLDGSLLDGGGLLEAVGVDASKQVLAESHRVEGWDDLKKSSWVSLPIQRVEPMTYWFIYGCLRPLG